MAGSAHRKGLLRAFLEYEVANPTPFVPSHFELSFGRARPESCDPSSIDTPVELDLGEGSHLLLAGRVDRIDIDLDGRFLVIDYKTGMLPKLADVKEGKSLQVQPYMQAVQQMLKDSQGVGGIFYLVEEKTRPRVEYSTIVVDEKNALALKNVIGRKRFLDQPIGRAGRSKPTHWSPGQGGQ